MSASHTGWNYVLVYLHCLQINLDCVDWQNQLWSRDSLSNRFSSEVGIKNEGEISIRAQE